MTAPARLQANRANARHSTGPRTVEGKAVAAQNALKHGLFSRTVALAHEDPEVFQALLDNLNAELRPSGQLETSLVERIALALWRQRRLVSAETASIQFQLDDRKIASQVSCRLESGSRREDIDESDLQPVDPEHLEWCRQALRELDDLDSRQLMGDWPKLAERAPLVYAELLSDAGEESQTVEEYLGEFDRPDDYFRIFRDYCRKRLSLPERQPRLLALAETVREERSILWGDIRDKLAKYQVQLDNDLLKAVKALREAQEWRLKTIEAADGASGFVLENDCADQA